MKAIMVMYDSLNRSMLLPYGCEWVDTPNFGRLEQRAVTFDCSYVGSMPCMPARRELHTGRYNFLHRDWGPLEPFDDSMPQILREHGVYSHLISDHYHYWEDGGASYHNRYSSWEIVRGQEGDRWKGVVREPEEPEHLGVFNRFDEVNRSYIHGEDDMPQNRVFELGLEFMEQNRDVDDWFLQIETFDPHEPFFCAERFKERYPDEYPVNRFDWPPYRKVTEADGIVEHVRNQYAALTAMCDENLGKVLDLMDRYEMWDDTMLIVNTDHGFLLGEHECWAKCVHPLYEEVSHTPLFVWDPRTGKKGCHRKSLVQTIDLAPTLLDYFQLPVPEDMTGKPLTPVIMEDMPIRETGIFGIHGGQLNITDGTYIYMRATDQEWMGTVYNYTLMPAHMRALFSVEELREMTVAPPFSFTKGCPVMKVEGGHYQVRPNNMDLNQTFLFNLADDPEQKHPIRDEEVERRMETEILRHLDENDAPVDLYERLGFS